MHKREEVTTIKINRRLLLTAAVGAVLILSAVLIVSMPGNDKPRITDNPPADDEESQDTPTAPVVTPSDVPESTDSDPDDAQTDPDDPEDDDDQGDEDENPPSDNGKARGLARALQAHERNMEKRMEMGKEPSKGLESSMYKLAAKHQAQLLADLADQGDDGEDDEDTDQKADHSNNGDNGKHNGNGQSEGT